MKKSLFFLLFVILISSGCTNKSLTFSGESKHWNGNYSVDVDQNNEYGTYTFHYKNGDSNTKFKTLEVAVNDGKTLKHEDDFKGATIKLPYSCEGCSVTRKDESIKVNIKWDNTNEETFFLKIR